MHWEMFHNRLDVRLYESIAIKKQFAASNSMDEHLPKNHYVVCSIFRSANIYLKPKINFLN